METKIKATVYAAKLRVKLAELKTAREKALADYKIAFTAWKKDLAAWVTKNSKARIDAITQTEVKSVARGRWNSNPCFRMEAFFTGCPAAPEYPDDKQIRDITALLHHLGITGKEEVRLSTADVVKYLGDGGKSED